MRTKGMYFLMPNVKNYHFFTELIMFFERIIYKYFETCTLFRFRNFLTKCFCRIAFLRATHELVANTGNMRGYGNGLNHKDLSVLRVK